MKKRIVKGILATTLALVSVFGVPQCKNLNAKLDTSITAEAASCRHNGSHWYTYEWVTISTEPKYGAIGIDPFTGAALIGIVGHYDNQRQYRVEHCAKCGARIDVVSTGKERKV